MKANEQITLERLEEEKNDRGNDRDVGNHTDYVFRERHFLAGEDPV
jgi:hypothetical protein